MTKQVFTPEQVVALNNRQNDGNFHPFTCGSGDRCGDSHAKTEGILVATVRGWICPFCDYTQDWAHDSTKNH